MLGLVHYDLGIEQDVKYGDLSKVCCNSYTHLRTLIYSRHLVKASLNT